MSTLPNAIKEHQLPIISDFPAGEEHQLTTISDVQVREGCPGTWMTSVPGSQGKRLSPTYRHTLEIAILDYVHTHVFKRQDRQAVSPRGMCLGLHTRRGAWVTKATHQHKQLLHWCHELAQEHVPGDTVSLHRDRFNLQHYPNM
eukprot:6005659-Amphidinium_carterae.1